MIRNIIGSCGKEFNSFWVKKLDFFSFTVDIDALIQEHLHEFAQIIGYREDSSVSRDSAQIRGSRVVNFSFKESVSIISCIGSRCDSKVFKVKKLRNTFK
jgi:hypothetical protein